MRGTTGNVKGGPPRDGVRLGDDDASAATVLLEHLVYDSLSLGVMEHSDLASAASNTTATSAAAVRGDVGNKTTSWGLGLARAMGMLSPANSVAAAAGTVQSATPKTPSGEGVDAAGTPPLLGFDASICMTPANGVQPLVDMLRGGTDAMLMEAFKPAFQALSLHTKLAVAEGGAHDELMALIGTGGCGDLMIHLLINRGEIGTGAAMSGEGVPELADAIAATAADDPMGAGAAAASAVPALVRLLRRGNQDGRRRGAAAIWSLAIGSPAVVAECHRLGAVPALLKAVQDSGGSESGDEAIGALWALASAPEHAGQVIAAGGVPIAVAHLVRGGLEGREAAAALLGACATARDGCTVLIDAGAVETLTEVLRGTEHAAAAAAAAAAASLAPARSSHAKALARLADCVVQLQRPPGAAVPRRTATLRAARQICALIEQLIYDIHVSSARRALDDSVAAAEHDSSSMLSTFDALVAKEALEGGSRARAIASLFESVTAVWGGTSTTLYDAVAATAPMLNGTTLTRLVSAGAAVPMRTLVSAERLAQPLMEYVAAAVAQIGSRGEVAGGLVVSARALAYVLNDSHYKSNLTAAGQLRRGISTHFPRLATVASGVGFGGESVVAAVGTLHALAAADGELLLAAAEAGALGSLALAMRRFGPDPAGVAAAAALWTMCAIGPEARDTLVDNGVVAYAVALLPMNDFNNNGGIISGDAVVEVERMTVGNTPLVASAANEAQSDHPAALSAVVDGSMKSHPHMLDAPTKANVTSIVNVNGDNNDYPTMPAPLAGVGLLACLIAEPGAAEDATAAGAVPRLVELLELHTAAAVGSIATVNARWIGEAAEAAALVLRAMFSQRGFVHELVKAGAVGALARAVRFSGDDDGVVGDHAVAALVAAMESASAAAATDGAGSSPAVSFAVEQARALASRLLTDAPDGPASSDVLEALVLDVLFAQYTPRNHNHDDASHDFNDGVAADAPPEVFACRAAVHALLVAAAEGSGARRTAAAGAVAALSIQSKAAIIRAGGGALDPLVAACGPWAPEALVHYLVTAPDTRHVGPVARALQAVAEVGLCQFNAVDP
jgi:hypothetical protein